MVHTKIRGDTSMKTRTLIRKHGWTPVDVDALEIVWDKSFVYYTGGNKDNRNHYRDIIEWCDQRIGKENYASTLQKGGGAHNVKRFIFKQAKHATMFRLKWLTS
jgi:hypothetical protein